MANGNGWDELEPGEKPVVLALMTALVALVWWCLLW